MKHVQSRPPTWPFQSSGWCGRKDVVHPLRTPHAHQARGHDLSLPARESGNAASSGKQPLTCGLRERYRRLVWDRDTCHSPRAAGSAKGSSPLVFLGHRVLLKQGLDAAQLGSG